VDQSPLPSSPRGGEKSLTPNPSPKGEGSRMNLQLGIAKLLGIIG